MNSELEIEQSLTLKKRDNIEIAEADEEKRWKMVLNIIPDIEFNRVLDIGCGLGTCMKALEPRSKEIIGLDVYPIGKKVNPELDIREFDLNIGELPFENNSFDLVVATDVIEHIYHPHYILGEIKRVMKNEGCAVISLPNACAIYHRRDVLFGRRVTDHGFDSFSHHYFTNIEQNRDFVTTEFRVIKEVYQWIEGGKAGLMAKLIKKPELFAVSVMFLCRK